MCLNLRITGKLKSKITPPLSAPFDNVLMEGVFRYCRKIHNASPPEDPAETSKPTTVYHTLLSLYLRPPPPYKQQLEPALVILSRHGARLEASDALKLIPEDIKISDLESYFQSRIRHTNSRMTENRMAAKLRKSFLVDVQEKLLDFRNRNVIVSEERVCPVCHKRLGTSVILRLARYANHTTIYLL